MFCRDKTSPPDPQTSSMYSRALCSPATTGWYKNRHKQPPWLWVMLHKPLMRNRNILPIWQMEKQSAHSSSHREATLPVQHQRGQTEKAQRGTFCTSCSLPGVTEQKWRLSCPVILCSPLLLPIYSSPEAVPFILCADRGTPPLGSC